MPRVLVLYYSRTGGTKKMAEAVAEGMKEAGVEVELKDKATPEELAGFDAIVIGTATYNHNMVRGLQSFLEEVALKGIDLKGKIGAAFGSYGWSGEGPRLALEVLKNKFEMDVLEPPLLIKYKPTAEGLKKCKEFGKKVAEKALKG